MFTEMDAIRDIKDTLSKLADAKNQRSVIRFFMEQLDMNAAAPEKKRQTGGLGGVQGFGDDSGDQDASEEDEVVEIETVFGTSKVNLSSADRSFERTRR